MPNKTVIANGHCYNDIEVRVAQDDWGRSIGIMLSFRNGGQKFVLYPKKWAVSPLEEFSCVSPNAFLKFSPDLASDLLQGLHDIKIKSPDKTEAETKVVMLERLLEMKGDVVEEKQARIDDLKEIFLGRKNVKR